MIEILQLIGYVALGLAIFFAGAVGLLIFAINRGKPEDWS